MLWCAVFLNIENRDLDYRNLRPMLKISYAASPCLHQLILAQFTFEVCLAVRYRQKIHKNPYFGAQSHLRSLESVPIER